NSEDTKKNEEHEGGFVQSVCPRRSSCLRPFVAVPHDAAHNPGCGGLTSSQATTPVRFVSRRNSFPPCVTYSHERPGPPNARSVTGVEVNCGLLRMFVHRPGCSQT